MNVYNFNRNLISKNNKIVFSSKSFSLKFGNLEVKLLKLLIFFIILLFSK